MTKKQVRERWYEKMYQDDKPLVDYEDWLENEVIRLSEPAPSNQIEVEWHKFPEELPMHYKDFWVTLNDSAIFVDCYNEGMFQDFGNDVIAWAEIIYPKPFTVEGEKV